MQAALVEVVDGDGSGAADLLIETEGSLEGVGAAQRAGERIDGGVGAGGRIAGALVARLTGGRGIAHGSLHLVEAIQADGRDDVVLIEAVVEDAVAAAQNGDRRTALTRDAKRKREARRDIVRALDVALRLVAKARR